MWIRDERLRVHRDGGAVRSVSGASKKKKTNNFQNPTDRRREVVFFRYGLRRHPFLTTTTGVRCTHTRAHKYFQIHTQKYILYTDTRTRRTCVNREPLILLPKWRRPLICFSRLRARGRGGVTGVFLNGPEINLRPPANATENRLKRRIGGYLYIHRGGTTRKSA